MLFHDYLIRDFFFVVFKNPEPLNHPLKEDSTGTPTRGVMTSFLWSTTRVESNSDGILSIIPLFFLFPFSLFQRPLRGQRGRQSPGFSNVQNTGCPTAAVSLSFLHNPPKESPLNLWSVTHDADSRSNLFQHSATWRNPERTPVKPTSRTIRPGPQFPPESAR